MAEAVLAAKAARAGVASRLRIASAGTKASAGTQVDSRALSVCVRRGYDIAPRRPRGVTVKDFARFDAIFAMDEGNLRALEALRPASFEGRLALLLSLVPACAVKEVPDP
jgi:protein-tyrosine phosphatase